MPSVCLLGSLATGRQAPERENASQMVLFPIFEAKDNVQQNISRRSEKWCIAADLANSSFTSASYICSQHYSDSYTVHYFWPQSYGPYIGNRLPSEMQPERRTVLLSVQRGDCASLLSGLNPGHGHPPRWPRGHQRYQNNTSWPSLWAFPPAPVLPHAPCITKWPRRTD